MADDASPIDPKKRLEDMQRRKADLDAVTEKRKAMLDAERARTDKREQQAQEQSTRERADYEAQIAAGRERGEEREEWRQRKHGHDREEKAERLRKVEEERQAEEKRKRAEEERREKEEYMVTLHKLSVRKKMTEKRESLARHEEQAMKTANLREVSERSAIDATEHQKLAVLQGEKQRKVAAAQADAERARKLALEKARQRQSQNKPKKGSFAPPSNPASDLTYKRELLFIEDQLTEKTRSLDIEFSKLMEEAKKDAANKRGRSLRDAERKARDAQRKRKTEEEWLDRGDGKKKEEER